MGVFIIVVVLFFIVLGMRTRAENNLTEEELNRSRKQGSSGGSASSDVPEALEFRARIDKLDGFDVILLEIRGPVEVPVNNYSIPFGITADDITGGNKDYIICSYEKYQAEDLPILHIVDARKMPYRSSVLPDWAPFAVIPIDSLTFAYKGQRTIKFSLKLGSTPLIERSCRLSVQATEFGYKERVKNRKKCDLLAAKLAFAVSAIDGEVHKDEASLIKTWIQKRVDATSDDAFKAEISSLIQSEMQEFKNDPTSFSRDIKTLANDICKISTNSERYDLLELLMKVVSADSTADPREMKIIHEVTSYLDLDETKFREMRDLHIPAAMICLEGNEGIDSLLGVKSSMSDDEIRKHLRAEYRKWNSLAAHPDKEKRDQAEYMLKLIGERRSQLNKPSNDDSGNDVKNYQQTREWQDPAHEKTVV